MIHFFWKNSYRPGLTQMILYIYIFMMMMMFYTFRYIHHQRHREFFSGQMQSRLIQLSRMALMLLRVPQGCTVPQLYRVPQLPSWTRKCNWCIFRQSSIELYSRSLNAAQALRCVLNSALWEPRTHMQSDAAPMVNWWILTIDYIYFFESRTRK